MNAADETRARDAIAQTAQTVRRESERSPAPLTQAQAEERVRRARVRGDQIRDNDNR